MLRLEWVELHRSIKSISSETQQDLIYFVCLHLCSFNHSLLNENDFNSGSNFPANQPTKYGHEGILTFISFTKRTKKYKATSVISLFSQIKDDLK